MACCPGPARNPPRRRCSDTHMCVIVNSQHAQGYLNLCADCCRTSGMPLLLSRGTRPAVCRPPSPSRSTPALTPPPPVERSALLLPVATPWVAATLPLSRGGACARWGLRVGGRGEGRGGHHARPAACSPRAHAVMPVDRIHVHNAGTMCRLLLRYIHTWQGYILECLLG
jgi:hypothetical protein